MPFTLSQIFDSSLYARHCAKCKGYRSKDWHESSYRHFKFYYKVNIKKVQRCFKVYQNYRCFYFLGKIASYLYSIQSGRNCTTPFMCLAAQSCPTLCDSMDWSPPGSSVHGDSPCKSTGMGFHALLKKWSLGCLF